jgi:glycolate oxidase
MITPDIVRQLEAAVGAQYVTTAPEALVANSQDALKQVFCAEAVVFPRTAEEIAAIMKLANERRFYVTARGGGVGYTGGAGPCRYAAGLYSPRRG